MGEVMSNTSKRDEGFIMKPVVMAFCYFLGVGLTRALIPEPYAASLVTLLIGLTFYWIPPKPKMSYLRWAIRCLYIATSVFMIFTVYVVIKKQF